MDKRKRNRPTPTRNHDTSWEVVKMNTNYYVNVAELMLPRPRLRDNILDRDRAEQLHELPIIKIRGDLNFLHFL